MYKIFEIKDVIEFSANELKMLSGEGAFDLYFAAKKMVAKKIGVPACLISILHLGLNVDVKSKPYSFSSMTIKYLVEYKFDTEKMTNEILESIPKSCAYNVRKPCYFLERVDSRNEFRLHVSIENKTEADNYIIKKMIDEEAIVKVAKKYLADFVVPVPEIYVYKESW